MNRLEQVLQEKGGPLLGASVYTYNPAFVEICALLGFQVVWLEQEHAPMGLAQVEDLCRIAAGLGLVTMIRVPDARRENVLRAAECAPDILDLPMGNTVEDLRELARHARYAPRGERGCFGASRAVRYGIGGSLAEHQARINDALHLMAQIETREAVERAEELCSVEGVDGIFLGPGDLSVSYGVPGQTTHPKVFEVMNRTTAVAKRHGKRVAMAAQAKDAARWAAQGVDVLFCTNDVVAVRTGAQAVLDQYRASLGR